MYADLFSRSIHVAGPAPRPRPLQIYDNAHTRSDERRSVERLIAEIYAEHYGAELQHWMPTLVCLHDGDEPFVAAGYRGAGEGALFLEQYLHQPVEQILAARSKRAIPRERIVEVGQFASRRAGGGRRLMLQLALHLAAQGYAWVVSTATQELRLIFDRLGIEPIELGRADPAVLGVKAAQWGSYYEHAPVVLAGEIAGNLARLHQRLDTRP